MKFRRVKTEAETELQVETTTGWVAVAEVHRQSHGELIDMLEANRPDPDQAGGVLPFQPRSYRDFMLFERHYIQAARGYVRRFQPGLSWVARAFEAITRQTFPAFKPSRLWWREPIYYMGNHLRFLPDGADVAWPYYSEALDYELELGFVLKRDITDATEEEALDAIGGFVVFNDISARDVQRPEMTSGFGPQKSKHFCNTMSAVLVSADEILDRLDDLTGRVLINGEIVTQCSSKGMRFSLGEALAHASKAETVLAGEFFASGTWPDGSGLETGAWIKSGDVVTLEIDAIGSVTNRIVDDRDDFVWPPR